MRGTVGNGRGFVKPKLNSALGSARAAVRKTVAAVVDSYGRGALVRFRKSVDGRCAVSNGGDSRHDVRPAVHGRN